MNSLLPVVLSAFGVFYAAVSLALMDGPFDVFATIRQRLGQRSWIGRGWHCPICLSLYLAILPAAVLADSLRSFPFLWLGIAGGATFLYKAAWK